MSHTTDETDRVWRALAHPARRTILDLLADRPRTTGELVDGVAGLCRTAVMKHIGVLEDAHLIVVRRDGRVRWNTLNPVPIQQVCDRWLQRHVQRTARAMNRLKQHIES